MTQGSRSRGGLGLWGGIPLGFINQITLILPIPSGLKRHFTENSGDPCLWHLPLLPGRLQSEFCVRYSSEDILDDIARDAREPHIETLEFDRKFRVLDAH